MERREPPTTAEGWYVLHDLRRVDWDAWRDAPDRERQRAVAEGVSYLRDHENLADTDGEEGGSATFSVLGHEADMLVVHMRPTTAAIDLAERRFERTAFSAFTDRTASYVSVTEVSAYTTDALGDGGIEDVEDEGLARYLRSRLYPDLPEADHVCFYPMSKRRGPEDNWYDLPFEERADLMGSHGEIGREYAGDVTQIITGSVGLDDYEWGVTLFADDPTDIKHLLYEMRFDPSSSRFVDFGPFYFGRRLPPSNLDAYLAGEPVPSDDEGTRESADGTTSGAPPSRPPTDDAGSAHGTDVAGSVHGTDAVGSAHGTDEASTGGRTGDTEAGPTREGAGDAEDEEQDPELAPTDGPPTSEESLHEDVDEEVIRRELRGLGIRVGDHPDAGYALVFRSSADAENLVPDVEELRGNFAHYETHVLTTVRAEAGQSAVASLWANRRAADVASGFIADLSGVEPGIGGPVEDAGADAGNDGTASTSGTDAGDDGPATGDDTDGAGDVAAGSEGTLREELAAQGIYAGQPHGQDVYAMVVYSEADPGDIADELTTLRQRFDRDDSHLKTAVYRTEHRGRSGNGKGVGDGVDAGAGDGSAAPVAVASIWETEDAAVRAGRAVADLPGVIGRPDEGEGFETLGLFYTVEPEFREDFRERFETVGDLLSDMEGHRETALLVNREDENDMFVASRWRSREDALAFFRSDAFRDTVQWGREVLADRPRHVFLT